MRSYPGFTYRHPILYHHVLPCFLQVDVVVVGGGPIGLSTAHMCAKEGKKVAVLEKYVLYNASGSSADFMRMFRTMYTEDYMVIVTLTLTRSTLTNPN